MATLRTPLRAFDVGLEVASSSTDISFLLSSCCFRSTEIWASLAVEPSCTAAIMVWGSAVDSDERQNKDVRLPPCCLPSWHEFIQQLRYQRLLYSANGRPRREHDAAANKRLSKLSFCLHADQQAHATSTKNRGTWAPGRSPHSCKRRGELRDLEPESGAGAGSGSIPPRSDRETNQRGISWRNSD